MTSFHTQRLSEDDLLSSQSSDEKMDTGSESIRSQDTPNSILSSDFDGEAEVLRLQNPENGVLRLSEPEKDTKTTKLKSEINDRIISKLANVSINSVDNRPRNLGISPPRLSSTLTLTTDHPLMGLGSPDENYPDVVPKKLQKEEEKDLSLSSIEDERVHTNGYELYMPQRNTSKNNLYFSENFATAESQLLKDCLNDPPDVARIEQKKRRKIIPSFTETPRKVATPKKVVVTRENGDDSAIIKYVEERNKRAIQSTPKGASGMEGGEAFQSGPSEWCVSPVIRLVPNFDLPIEMSSNIAQNDLASPDVISSSTQEDKSAYQALLDPYTGSVALRPTVQRSPAPQRRKVVLPPDDDCCSLDSISGCSMESEEEPPAPEPLPQELQESQPSEDDDTKRSKSTATASECSDPIPEYSAAEEFREERSWLSVAHGGGISNCDMKVIEPYKRAISHGGYDEGDAAIIVFSACHLPDTARPDYRYVMDNLFLYVIWTLERLVTDEYVLVYLHGARRRTPPSAAWLHECYKLVDRRLRKSLKHLYLVHPTFWLKSFVVITKPFVSSKFFRKLSYVRNLDELLSKVPVEPNAIPDLVKEYDARRR